jgi:hypothetical protein
MSTANSDDKLVQLRAEFGMWAIGVYWTLVELVATQISEKSESAEATLIVPELLGLFRCKRPQLVSYLSVAQDQSLLTYSLTDNILKINIAKLLDYADNYIKYEGKSLKSLQRKNKVSSKQDKIRIDKNRIEEKEHIEVLFEEIWKQYPNRQGKKNALRHFLTTVEDGSDFDRIRLALKNYLASKNVKKGFIKNGSTWFNEWQDWETPAPAMMGYPPTPKKKLHECLGCHQKFERYEEYLDHKCPKAIPPPKEFLDEANGLMEKMKA